MWIIRVLYLYVFGYVNIEVEGFFVERFINICISKRIFLWKLVRKNSTVMYAKIGVKDFKRIKNVAKKTKCKVSLESKKGLPFLLNRYKKRKIFAITLGVIAILIFGLTRFVWNIDIYCDGDIDKQEIIKLLEKDGIKEGVLISKINKDKVINEIRMQRDDISWVGIRLDGTNVIVNIVKSIEKPQIIASDEPCNIISDKEAIITKISVQNGTARVKEGDTIKIGDLLVEGVMEGKYTGNRYVHSEADIKAKIWYTKEEEASLKQEHYIDTGKEQKRYEININKFKINFNKRLPKFKKYDTIETGKKLKLFSNFYIPIEIKTINYKEKKLEYVEYTMEELSNELQKKLKKELLEENNILEENIIEITPIVTLKQDKVNVKLICVTEEEIGTLEQLVY